jgi:hypothetical protein
MNIERRTERALLVTHDAVSFWIQRRWMRADGTLTPAGWKAYHIARREHLQHPGFDVLKEFPIVRQTEKAALLRCAVERPDGPETAAEFWLPREMAGNWNFVAAKVREVERRFPFANTHVRWSGAGSKA